MADQTNRSPGILKTTGRASVMLIVAAGIGAVTFAGISFLHARAEARPEPQQREPITVATQVLTQQNTYSFTQFFSGRVEAREQTAVAFELSGLVMSVAVEEGQIVGAGTLLAEMDTALLIDERRRLRADRTALEADLAFARKTEARQKSLEKKGFAATSALDQAESSVRSLNARIAATDAAIASVETRIKKSTLLAPFDGVVVERSIDPGAVLDAGMPVLTLMSTDAPELRIAVSPDAAASLSVSQSLGARIDDRYFQAVVMVVLPDVDPITRSVDVLFQVDRREQPRVGQTVSVAVERSFPRVGYWLPRGALSEGERGLWTVLTIDESGAQPVASREAVRILHAEAERVFVEGSIRSGSQVIISGTHRLAPGQPVAPKLVE